MSLPDKIFLLGMPGSGKSTLGSQIAQQCQYAFTDLDVVIENNSNSTIAEIFDKRGEAAFRKIEAQTLKVTLTKKNEVVATGGGTPCFYDNMNLMNAHGLTVYLDTPLQILKTRLISEGLSKRPKLNKDQSLETILSQTLKQREKYYKQAHVHIKGDSLKVHDVISILKEYTNRK